MKKTESHDEEEEKLITSYERGEFKPVKDQKGAKQTAVEAAKSYNALIASVLSDKREG